MKTHHSIAILGVMAVSGIAAGLVVTDEGRNAKADASALERACAGLLADRQLEDALATARALSDGGFDQICASLQSQRGDVLLSQGVSYGSSGP